jgi:DNA-binding transcriptional ArsR family regulator
MDVYMSEARRLQNLLQTLGDANRLRIIRNIGEGSRSVSEIVKATGLSQPLVSHHLRTLREARILITRREGPFVFYSLSDTKLLEALGMFTEIAGSIGDDALTREPMFFCPPWWKRHMR